MVADNCTDGTAEAARRAGAFVYERFDQSRKGKGYAMDYLFRRLAEEGKDVYDGYFVFDADNLVDPGFVAEMNRTFDRGYDAVTCYPQLQELRHQLDLRRLLHLVSAGGPVPQLPPHPAGHQLPRVGHRLPGVRPGDPGKRRLAFHLLTEDIQFSVDCAIRGRRIGYCDKAVVYDEQPTTFRQSWDSAAALV